MPLIPFTNVCEVRIPQAQHGYANNHFYPICSRDEAQKHLLMPGVITVDSTLEIRITFPVPRTGFVDVQPCAVPFQDTGYRYTLPPTSL